MKIKRKCALNGNISMVGENVSSIVKFCPGGPGGRNALD